MTLHFRAILAMLVAILLSVTVASAQDLHAVARVDPDESGLTEGWFGRATLTIALSHGVPFRVFTLDAPARLVIDFREVDFSGLSPDTLKGDGTVLTDVRFGRFQPGWSRLIADLAQPYLTKDITLRADNGDGIAQLELQFVPTEPEVFAAAAGAPKDALWPDEALDRRIAPVEDDQFVVVIDPGHGGIDPGAERDGETEKDLMLRFAQSLRDALERADDVEVLLTRDDDRFVSLEARVAHAHQANADLFLSLHADALSQGGAQGATLYLLSDEASDAATAHLAARHNRADIIAGADLTGSDDEIASVLLDLARQETEPRSEQLAQMLLSGMRDAGGPMNRRPLRKAGFSVLKSADIPSVLVELGFLSSTRDLNNLKDSAWRDRMVGGIVAGILDWRDADAARRSLVRQ
jgi:N-acetylmuramoyl-L-alanine amidase